MKNFSKKFFFLFLFVYLIVDIILWIVNTIVYLKTGVQNFSVIAVGMPILFVFGLISQIYIYRLATKETRKGIRIASRIAIVFFIYALSVYVLTAVVRALSGS